MLLDLFHAVVLGIVEGATEFIPVSSTGHLIVATDLLGLDPEETRMVVFNIVIQLAAILAVVWIYRAKILDVTRRLTTDPSARRFATAVVVGCIPAAAIGLVLDDWIEANLFTTVTVASALIVGGLLILAVEAWASRRTPRVDDVDAIRVPDAVKVGLAQCLALMPGVSRSGATILGGMGFGLSRVAATEFSFFLAIPIMVGASGLKLFKNLDALSAADVPFFAVGCLVSFLSAMVVIRMLLRFIATHTFRPFAYYRIVFGTLILIWALTRGGAAG